MTVTNIYNFGPAAECDKLVYGAGRPRWESHSKSQESVRAWLDFMHSNCIQSVCCLLSLEQIQPFSDLIGMYRKEFGDEHVLWVPIPDFSLVSSGELTDHILPFLIGHSDLETSTVVHCSAGSGRTGHILALWLAHRYGLATQEAIDAVRHVNNVYRNPLEAIQTTTDRSQLEQLFASVRKRM